MSLTPDQQRLLEKPFAADEHGFVQDGIFIRKSAIRQRLHQVDPGYSIGQPQVIYQEGDVIAVSLPLIVAGVIRHGIGTGLINRLDSSKKPLEGFRLAREIAKAIKSAASDGLPRAALEFGVGNYLKNKPGDVTKAGFPDWLKSLAVLEDAPAHWAFNGGGQRVNRVRHDLGLAWKDVQSKIEPGRTLEKLSDTVLIETEVVKRLTALATYPAAPRTSKAGEPAPADASH